MNNLILDQTYNKCVSEGLIIVSQREVRRKAKALIEIAEEIQNTLLRIKPDKTYNSSFILSYDLIHVLAEAISALDKVKSSNHQCLFAHLCKNHQDLNLNWTFLETIRLKRNGLHYSGESINFRNWQNIQEESDQHIHALFQHVRSRLS